MYFYYIFNKAALYPRGTAQRQRYPMALRKEEINRKVLHAFTGSIVPALILYIPLYAPHFSWLPVWLTPRFYPPVLAAVASAFLTFVEIVRLKNTAMQRFFYRVSGATLRPEESKKMTGATYICYATLGCSVLFVDHQQVSFIVLSAFIWGDAAAALVGQSIGKTKIGTKSLEGSLGCFVLCMAFFLLVFPLVPHLLDPWKGVMSVSMALAASFVITIMELFPISINKKMTVNDNLTVPMVTGIIIVLLFPPL
jgi:dolichol kinase